MQKLFTTKCSLEELYEYEKYSKNISENKVYIETKHGIKKIENIDFTALNEATYLIETESGKSISASSNHILFSENEEIRVNNIISNKTFIETIDGDELVTNIEFIGFNDLIDIQVEEVHEFYTLSGIRTHNSTFSDAIKFGIYGRLENKKLKDIPNRLNKNTYVKIELMTKKGLVQIERGLEPNFFNLSINGAPVDKAGKRSVQEYLEEEILEMPFYVFCNTISLSINDFKSFIKMSNSDKKAIIDKIFGLQVINQMREVLKYQIKKIKEYVEDLSTSILAFTSSYESSKYELEQIESKIQLSSQEKKIKLQEDYSKCNSIIETQTSNLQKIQTKYTESQAIKRKIQNLLNSDEQELVSINQKLRLYENCKCPTCESDLETDFHKDLAISYITQKEIFEKNIEEKKVKKQKVVDNIEKLEQLKQKSQAAVTSAQANIYYIKKELDDMNESVDTLQVSSISKMMENFTEKIKEKKDEQIKNQKNIAFYNLAEEILSEKGVKQLAIKSIVPSLNSEISKFIKMLGLEHKIVFNNEFDAKISHFGIEVSAETLSTGETTKVDFAVLLAVIKMMKLKYPSMNMLFLDEIFSNVDGESQYNILKILRAIVRDYEINIYVISHYPLSYTEFDYKIEVSKNNGFSAFTVEKLT